MQINQKQQEERSKKDAEIEMLRKQLDEANEQLRMESESKKMWMDSAREAQEKVTTEAARIKALEDELRTLKEKLELMQLKLLDNDIEIRQLYETCIDLKGRIRLCVRIRPLIGNECITFQYIDIVNDNTVQIMHVSIIARNKELVLRSSLQLGWKSGSLTKRSKAVQCECEHLWLDDASQSDVFESSALYGSNVAIIAYGQTGSGKTYTMRGGDGDSAGIIPRALAMLFDSSAKLQLAGWVVEISLSILEIYVGKCYDLLDEHERRPFTLHFANNNPDFRELTSLAITTVDEALTGIARSDMLRSWARTDTSEYSSRGHTIVRIQINSYLPQQNKCLSSCISLVDLAGSERVKESGVSGERLEETKYINKSLSQLGVVLRAELAQGNHVPYTSDPLTKALSESLGAGSSKTMLIANIRPDSAATYESYRTIEFANQQFILSASSQTKLGISYFISYRPCWSKRIGAGDIAEVNGDCSERWMRIPLWM
ncbi:unnamed protein product [Anisakis simplex]|uniref:Kinesin-like protein n=1 Tax=Anisakis simplex TaxID=6269 RepID=A0A0M3K6M9_ANISI|nr:unnamed protein product [Anisakis simplex]